MDKTEHPKLVANPYPRRVEPSETLAETNPSLVATDPYVAATNHQLVAIQDNMLSNATQRWTRTPPHRETRGFDEALGVNIGCNNNGGTFYSTPCVEIACWTHWQPPNDLLPTKTTWTHVFCKLRSASRMMPEFGNI